MIKRISFIKYRKLSNISIDLSAGLNFISGANGTCKSSVLHLISNAYQRVKVRDNPKVRADANLRLLSAHNLGLNLKIESLTKGDKKYRDPAIGVQGSLYRVTYADNHEISFRRHISSSSERYSMKPEYKRGSEEKLPSIPVIYLGLTRLIPIGELSDDTLVKSGKSQFPDIYEQERIALFKRLTRHEIKGKCSRQKIGHLKTRDEFQTAKEGIDSNTISSGEDNIISIIKALVSLHYYYDSLTELCGFSESVLLIDEVDAAIHPSMQERLCDVFREYSEKYKIQIVCTTHSITLLDYAFEKKDNVNWVADKITHDMLYYST